MNNQEILSNIDYYDGQLKSLWNVRKKRHLNLNLNDPICVAEHARYLITSLRKMIKDNQKEQRIHRHYGFLQCLLLNVEVSNSIQDLMLENKYGAKKLRVATYKYGDGWKKYINSVDARDWDGKD